ncbi:Protein of unknown function [Pyronema omphalodes CBS 100304]|uniref:Uncharacterized protein n=1 Tax=Pyronema omphalodes (strain CBS 100304) TaxID=1076935 RepID=U4LMU6_PYROM|nr:Protein of unknown function [Pyronema omphalodes CBS 100304]
MSSSAVLPTYQLCLSSSSLIFIL